MAEVLKLIAAYVSLGLQAVAILMIVVGAIEAVIGILRVLLKSGRRDCRDPHVPHFSSTAISTRYTIFNASLAEATMPSMLEDTGLVSLGAVFTLLFVTLGPLKLLGPFAQLTRDTDESTLRKIVVRAFVIGLAAVLAGGFVGQFLLLSWNMTVSTMELAGGTIFILVGLRMVLEQYAPAHAAPPSLPTLPMAAAMRIAFPLVVTPYGIAALIVLLANSHNSARTASILAILIGVMVLNLLALLYVRRIMAGIVIIVLQILGAVLGVLQVALAMEMLLRGLQGLGILQA